MESDVSTNNGKNGNPSSQDIIQEGKCIWSDNSLLVWDPEWNLWNRSIGDISISSFCPHTQYMDSHPDFILNIQCENP